MLQVNTKQEFKEVVENNKHVVVDFFAEWCGPCKMLNPHLEQLKESEPEVTIAKVDIDSEEGQELAKMYQVMSIPNLVLFSDGEMKSRNIGFAPVERLTEWVNEHK